MKFFLAFGGGDKFYLGSSISFSTETMLRNSIVQFDAFKTIINKLFTFQSKNLTQVRCLIPITRSHINK
jgi:hypothetical protein